MKVKLCILNISSKLGLHGTFLAYKVSNSQNIDITNKMHIRFHY